MIIRKIVKFKIFIQLFFLAVLNSDIGIIIRSIFKKKAFISQSPAKIICAPGLNCYSCPSAVTACPIGSLQFWLNDVSLKINLGEKINFAGFYIIGFLSLIGGVGGRIPCGWICPFGFLQDLISKITKKNFPIHKILRSLKYVSLILFVIVLPLFIFDVTMLYPWFCKFICPAGTLQAGVPLLLVDKALRESASWLTVLKFSILIVFLVSFFLSRRSFCKILCPLGAFWSVFNKVSLFKLQVNMDTCTNCGKCSRICPMNIDVVNNPNSVECIRCMECVKACPVKSIEFVNIFKNIKKNESK